MTTTRKPYAAFVLTALALLAAAGHLRADDSVVMARGFKPNQIFQHNEFDSVNLFNGNLVVNVPLGVQYKSNGTLNYQFSLNYNSHVWDLMHYSSINFGSADFQHHGIIYWEYSSDWGGQWTPFPQSTPAPEGGITNPPSSSAGTGPNGLVTTGGNWSGIESIPYGNAGMGWMFSLGTFDGEYYTSQDGTLSKFYQALHGGPGGVNTVFYTNDGTYLRLRKLANDELNQQRVEIDFPDGLRKRYTCVDCPGTYRQQWNLDWISDPYGNVLLVEYSNGQGQWAPMQPANGPWIWTFLEMSSNNAEQGSGTQYFDGSLEAHLNLVMIRSHFAYFTRPRPWETRLDKVALAAPNGKHALYEFAYSNMTIPSTIGIPMWDEAGIVARYVIQNDPVTGRPKARRAASALSAIKLADPAGITNPSSTSTNAASAGVWQFRYYDNPDGYPGDPAPVQYPHADYPVSYLSGRLRVAKPPTGGGYRYEYAGRGYPTRLCHILANGGGGVHFTGVSKRQQINHVEDDVPNAAWYYVGRGWIRTADFGTQCPNAKEYLTAVIAPPNENGAESRISLAFFTAVSLSGFGMSRQGWPYTELELLCPDGTQNCNNQPAAKYLSQREIAGDYATFAADPSGSVRRMFTRYLRTGETQTAFTTKRSTYVRMESSFEDCPNGTNDMGCISFNLRKTLDRSVFHDDGDAWVETAFSQFDGLGHFRRSETTANFQQKNGPNMPVAWKTEDRVSITTWNPGVNYGGGSGVLPDGAPGANQPWFIEKYASTSVEEGGFTFTKLFEFDPNRNFIKSVRSLVDLDDPPTPANEDVLYTVERSGRLDGGLPVVNVRESWFGGDTGDFEEATYVKDRLLKYGSAASEEYRNCNLGGPPFLILHTSAIDANTGLATSMSDSAGAATSYAYDVMGRITSATPPGSSTPQVYSYRFATQGRSGLEGPNNLGTYADSWLKITRGSGPDLAYFFDFLGRQNREEEKLPNNVTNWTTFAYSPQGLLTGETTLIPGGSQNAVTEHTYDILDRETKIKYSDGMIREFILGGERVKTIKNNKVAIGASGLNDVSITEMMDAFGRVRRVNDNAVRADYWWDASDNLTRVDLNDNANDNDQSRFFSYDGRGFLTGETHPELGPGTVKHQMIDARGHSQRLHYVSDSNLDVDFTFDKAERMIQTRARHAPIAGAASWLTQNHFHAQDGSTVPAGTKAAGKLWKSLRRNFVPTPNNLGQKTAIEVKKTFGYDGRGRVSTMTLNSRYNGEFNATTSFHYDDLDQLTQIGYPTIVPVGSAAPAAPTRNITQTFSRGKLTGISASGASNWSIATLGYHANGLLASVTRTRSGTVVPSLVDRMDADPTGVRRPSRFTWEYVTTPPSQTKVTADSGQYFFDAGGNIYLIGNDRYRYDTSYRLKTAIVDGRTRTWDYDGFGNFTSRPAANDLSVPVTVDQATNRESGLLYDKLGNVTRMPDRRPGTPSPHLTFQYDLLSSMTSFDGNLIGRIFLYDADGERVAALDYKAPGGLREHWYLRGANDVVLRDFDRAGGTWSWVKDYVYRDGTLTSTIGAAESLRDVHVDHLGSTRLVTDSRGVPVVIGNTNDTLRKYWPFGELTVTRSIAERMSFTGHERDDDGTDSAEADLDYMHARYYAPAQGRFLSVDPGRDWDLRQPQSWNLYSYVRNSPVTNLDPDGRTAIRYLVKTVKGVYRYAKRSTAVRHAARGESHNVLVRGRKAGGQSKEARGVAREANPGEEVIRHDAHSGGPANGPDKRQPHHQPKRKSGGQVNYDLKTVVGAVAGLGAAAGEAVAQETGSELAGTVTATAIDFFNPVADIQEAADLLNEIGIDIIESMYDVELEDEEVEEKPEVEPPDPPRRERP